MLIQSFSSCSFHGEGGYPSTQSYTLVLGGFDGLHLGHRSLLDEAKKSGSPIALTTMFGEKGRVLFTREERRVLFERAGIACLLEFDLSGGLRDLVAEEFLRELFAFIPVSRVVCGEDFRFGRGALGTPALLRQLSPCPVSVLPILKTGEKDGGEKISVSLCKRLLGEGELSGLNAWLGSGYFLRGIVEHGREVGRTYGFPTLNLTTPHEKLLPPDGVYGGFCVTPKGRYGTIVNLGPCPTFDVAERRVEAYLDGFSGDLYGETVEIYLMEFYRGIEKFSSAEALKAQLQNDIARLRTRSL